MRLAAIDELRGVAVVLMVMHHVLDAWTHASDRTGPLWQWLRWLGGIPAPAFLFLAGVSAALVLSRERARSTPTGERVQAAVRRGLYVLGIAFAFRLFSFVAGGNPPSGWERLFRVDVLNGMGLALALVGASTALAATRRGAILTALGLAMAFALPAPFVFGHEFATPWHLAGAYVSGPSRTALFPLFPWAAFVALGAAFGEWLASSTRAQARGSLSAARPGLLAGLACLAAFALFQAPVRELFGPHDFWRSSPLVVIRRTGILLVLFWGLSELVARMPRPLLARDPLQWLGRHSLLAYFLHMELAWGRPVLALRQAVPLEGALVGALVLVVGCLGAAVLAEKRRSLIPLAGASPRPSPR